MDRQNSSEETRHQEEQTGIHLLMVCMASIFGLIQIWFTLVMSWELWTIPLVVIGILVIWGMHIGGFVTNALYEQVCIGFIVCESFYYGVHSAGLLSMPVVICIQFILLVLLDKKQMLYVLEAIYFLTVIYNFLFLRGEMIDKIGVIVSDGTHHTVLGMAAWRFSRIGIGMLGTLAAMILSGIMIDRRREERKKVQQLTSQLKAAQKQNADFLSNVSHELRTPINMVTGISEVALGKNLSPSMRQDMHSIQMAGKRLAGQINDILDYTEISSNTLVVVEENYMPVSIMNDLIMEISILEKNSKLELVFDLDPALPSVLTGDANKIFRVIWILLQNAIRFTEEGGVCFKMGFRQESYGINLDIMIRDTGPGMTSSRLHNDLNPTDNSSSHYTGGLGLGLPIARGLVNAMGGFILFEGKENEGTVVHISIPQKVADTKPCMEVFEPAWLCVACYFKHDKYSRSEVREFYADMLQHLAEKLRVDTYRVHQFEELERLLHSHQITHLFLAGEEYEENSSFFEKLAQEICVVLISGKEDIVQKNSRMVLLSKPFFALPVVNLFNGETHGKELAESMNANREFTCINTKALVVDDEEMNLVVAKGILREYGIRVDTCQSGAEAVKQCVDTIYDLIFLDHMMPGMDGVETLKRIRTLKDGVYRNLPIVALTANAISGAREMFRSEGFTEFVPKPVERLLLERILRRVLPEQNIVFYKEEDIKKEVKESVPEPKTLSVPAEPVSLRERLQRLGIDVELGLAYCNGSEDFYREILQMFCTQSIEKRKELVELYESSDWDGYAVKVHALKSTSRTLGAEELSGQAKALEKAAKKQDAVFIMENHEKMLMAYDALCEGIADSIHMKDSGEGGGLSD